MQKEKDIQIKKSLINYMKRKNQRKISNLIQMMKDLKQIAQISQLTQQVKITKK